LISAQSLCIIFGGLSLFRSFLILFSFSTVHVVLVQIAWLTEALTVKEFILVLAFGGFLSLTFFIITIKAHSFRYLGLLSVWTSKSTTLLFLLFLELCL